MCGMCEAHIAEALRRALPEAEGVRASSRRGEAVFFSERPPERDLLQRAVEETGYDYLSAESEACRRSRSIFDFLMRRC